jgi:hypothetical protein
MNTKMHPTSLTARAVSLLGAAFLTVVMLAAVDTLAVSDAPSGMLARAAAAARA